MVLKGVVRGVRVKKPTIYSLDIDWKAVELTLNGENIGSWGWCKLDEVHSAVNQAFALHGIEKIGGASSIFKRFSLLNKTMAEAPVFTWSCGETIHYMTTTSPEDPAISLGVFIPAGWVAEILDVVNFGIHVIDAQFDRVGEILVGREPLKITKLIGWKHDEGKHSRYEILDRHHGERRFLPLQGS